MEYTLGYSPSHVILLYACVKYIFISIIRSIGYGLVKCTGLLMDFTNLLCILNAFVRKPVVHDRGTLIGFPRKTFDHKTESLFFSKGFGTENISVVLIVMPKCPYTTFP